MVLGYPAAVNNISKDQLARFVKNFQIQIFSKVLEGRFNRSRENGFNDKQRALCEETLTNR